MDLALQMQLAEAKDYRSFLRCAIIENGKGCAAFSRRAGFSSRSFLSEVIRGHRRLSHASYEKVIQGLKLSGNMRRLFQLLVALEEPDVVPLRDRTDLRTKIEELRQKLRNSKMTSRKGLFLNHHVPVVYAALGSKRAGATQEDILFRTGLKSPEVTSILAFMTSNGLVYEREKRFFVTEVNLDLNELGEDKGFRQAFVDSLDILKKQAINQPQSDTSLFFYSAFSISPSQMSAFKRDLQQAVLSCMDKYQNEDAEKVCRLNLGFFS
jgi:uncharacterized protein (TIGR02147 family)